MHSHYEIYHVYNQGNDRRTIFKSDENYAFFLQKLQKRFKGAAEILAYCLMPNHYHLLLIPTEFGAMLSRTSAPAHLKSPDTGYQGMTNLSVAIRGLTSGYAQSFNKFYNRSGSVFRQKTKVERTGILDPNTGFLIDDTYTMNCFQYIHQNPPKAKLVNHPSEWAFTSYHEYAGFTTPEQSICNVELGRQLLGLTVDDFR